MVHGGDMREKGGGRRLGCDSPVHEDIVSAFLLGQHADAPGAVQEPGALVISVDDLDDDTGGGEK